jgi:hypothetical protein
VPDAAINAHAAGAMSGRRKSGEHAAAAPTAERASNTPQASNAGTLSGVEKPAISPATYATTAHEMSGTPNG